MSDMEQTNKAKVLLELQKNGRASLSELAKKTGLSRQTIAKTIKDMEKKKQIWGYTAIFDPDLVGKKPFIFLAKLDLSVNTEDFHKKVTSSMMQREFSEKYGFTTSMFLHGTSDIMVLIWTKDIIMAKKLFNEFKKIFREFIKEVELLDVIATFRNNCIINPKAADVWNNLLH
jgi:Lrp/AsnC family leucine-responsive transcriptional regulator